MASVFPAIFQEIESIPGKNLHRNQVVGHFHDSTDLKSVGYFHDLSNRVAGYFHDSRTLKMAAGAHFLPKEDEDKPLGEDAYFISDDKQTIGIADGVGSYANYGIDSGEYARELMDNASEFINKNNGVDPMAALNHAFENNFEEGASTACIITLMDNTLQAVNIGDSGFLVIRNGKIVYKSPVQQQYFNCPFQLAVSGKRTPAKDAEEMAFEVQRGDVAVAATDGLFDNLFDDEIEETVKICLEGGNRPDVTALNLVERARRMSLLENTASPFTVAAIKDGLDRDEYMGGKYDDVTVVVGYIY